MVDAKIYIFTYFYLQYSVLFTMVLSNSIPGIICAFAIRQCPARGSTLATQKRSPKDQNQGRPETRTENYARIIPPFCRHILA